MIDLFKSKPAKSAKDSGNCSFTAAKGVRKNSCLLYVNTTTNRVTYGDILKCIFNGNEQNEYYQVLGKNTAFIIYFSTDDSKEAIGNKLTGFSLANDDCITFHLFYGIQDVSYFIRDSKDVTGYVTKFFGCNS
jgi:hypothetical protein